MVPSVSQTFDPRREFANGSAKATLFLPPVDLYFIEIDSGGVLLEISTGKIAMVFHSVGKF